MSAIRIDPEFKALIPPLAKEEFAQLEENILRDGCRDALVVWDGLLLDGHNRHKICTENLLPFEIVKVELASRDEAKVWVIKNQLGRRNLQPFQRGELVLVGEPLIAALAKANQIRKPADSVLSTLTEQTEPISTRSTLADMAGVSDGTMHKIKVIAQKGAPEVKEKLRAGDVSVNAAYTELKRAEREGKREERREENRAKVAAADTPETIIQAGAKFATIVIDPPWDWGDEGDGNQMGRAKPDYATMPIEKIAELPVADLADEDCHLYLWITNRSLPKGFALLERWGFRYVTALTWAKPHFGMGNYFRGQTEHVLFGIKGSQPLKRKDVGTIFHAGRGEGHSAKPEIFYDLVQSCSPGPFLEMFSRSEREGWTMWGEG